LIAFGPVWDIIRKERVGIRKQGEKTKSEEKISKIRRSPAQRPKIQDIGKDRNRRRRFKGQLEKAFRGLSTYRERRQVGYWKVLRRDKHHGLQGKKKKPESVVTGKIWGVG